MENKTVTLSRHLALVSLVERNPGIALGELAEIFGFTKERMHREILLLDRAGIGDLLPDETFFFDMDLLEREGRVQLQYDLGASGLQPLTDEEVTRLIMGLAAVSTSLDADESQLIPHLLGVVLRLGESDGAPDLPDVSRLLSVIEPRTRTWEELVERASDEGRELHLTYLAADSRLSERTVDPLSRFQGPDGWILRAWCHRARAERNFRLDRIVSAKLGVPVEAGRVRRSSRVGGKSCHVTLTSQAEWLLGELPIEASKRVERGIRVTFRVWEPQWMAEELILMAPYVLDVEPLQYWELAQANAETALGVWDSLPTSQL